MAESSECAHVSEKKTHTCSEDSDTSFNEISSIAKPATPVHEIVQRQVREVIQLQNAAFSQLQESVYCQESFMRDHLISKEEHLSKLNKVEQSVQDNFVRREEHDALVQKLEQEQHSHADTKLRLMEVTDKLDFTLGEVEVLNRQLSKEKEAFQQIVDSLRSQVAKGNNWNEELEAKYTACQRQCQDLNARLSSREVTIESLEERLASQQKQCERKIEEIEVERQQDQYVARMLEDKSRNGRARKSGNNAKQQALKVKR
ncbi:spermatogenesis-associated protein 24-like [Babylonia areolata]|uniref:spermatogenesis-associated protein 24-like n=1 Tax=Babylonia areolata TaxID=304850 RepID=UPI003FD1B0D5